MKTDRQRGFALMLVIWVLAIFMVLVMSFSFSTRVETQATMTFKERIEEKFLAEGGLERAIAEMQLKRKVAVLPDADNPIWRRDGSVNRVEYEQGFCQVSITSENGKVDINVAPELVLRGLMLSLGVKGEDADVIVDSLGDWRDADSLRRLNGAEDEYYQGLPVSYKAKNANFESIEELLLVRGVTPELFYGTAGKPGLAEFITVHAKSATINMNAAPREVLLAIPGLTPEMADALIEARKNVELKSANDAAPILGAVAGMAGRYLTYGDSTIFTIEAVGKKQAERPGYGIRAVVNTGVARPDYLQYRSPWETGTWKRQQSSPQS